jgi:hypothetical protein
MLTQWVLSLALLLTPAVAGAEEGHGHSHRGGQEVRIGIYEVELTVASSEMTLHVNDTKDQKVNTEDFTATAVSPKATSRRPWNWHTRVTTGLSEKSTLRPTQGFVRP